MECALEDFSEGTFNATPKANEFSDANYCEVWKRHIENVELYRDSNPRGFRKLQLDLWQEAWYIFLFV